MKTSCCLAAQREQCPQAAYFTPSFPLRVLACPHDTLLPVSLSYCALYWLYPFSLHQIGFKPQFLMAARY